MYWAALFLPSLSLDVFTRAWSSDDAAQRFVVASGGKAPLVVAASAAARDAGIGPGQSITSALALAPDIVLRDRDPDAESRALASLATWMLRFTPQVSLAPPDALVADIGGSLRLFGGFAPLVTRMTAGIEARGFAAQWGFAPTASAALLLAHAGDPAPVRQPRDLEAILRPLSLEHLGIDPATLAILAAAGIGTFGQAAALPRDALARRCGQALVTSLDRALGACADPREPYRPPPRFEARLELPVPVADGEALGFGVNRLVHELSAWLGARGLGVSRLTLTLTHERYLRQRGIAPTLVPFTLGAPARAPAHLTGVMRERLARVTLSAPVEAIAMASDETSPLAGFNLGLLPGDEASTVTVPLVDRLRARLGDEAVVSLSPHAEYRPERSDRTQPAHTAAASSSPRTRKHVAAPLPLPEAPRPIWLYDAPAPIGERMEAAPWVLKDGPERIESGWWDDHDVRRDYFVAETPDGEIAWIYRDHRHGIDDGEWFLHGLFA